MDDQRSTPFSSLQRFLPRENLRSWATNPKPYPFHDKTIDVTCCRRICLHRKKINLSTAFAGQLSVSKKSKKVFGWSAL
jgi:hypothetical protein